MKKRLLSVMMAAVMMLTIAPYSALAAENETIVTEEVQSENSETTSDEVSGENSEDGSQNNSDGSSVEDESVLYDEDMDSSFLIDSEENIEEQPTENGSGLDEGFTATQAEESGGQEVSQSENSYEVSSGEELSNAFAQIASSEENEAVIVLKNDVTVMGDETSTSSFGVDGKQIAVKSKDDNKYKLTIGSVCNLVGDTTFDNISITYGTVYANGHHAIFTENIDMNLRAIYGGSKNANVDSTYVVVKGGTVGGGDFSLVGGGDGGSVEGDVYLEVGGTAIIEHLMTGANTSDTNGYVGGDVNIVFDRPTTVEEAKSGVLGDIVNISGTYSNKIDGDLNITVKSGYVKGIEAQRGEREYSDIGGSVNIIVGDRNYEDTEFVAKSVGNWDIYGVGEQSYFSGSERFQVGGDVNITTYGNFFCKTDVLDSSDDWDNPGIRGAYYGNVGGNITINVYGSQVAFIEGLEYSTAENVTINMKDAEILGYVYDDGHYEGDDGYVAPVYDQESHVSGDVTVNLDGGKFYVIDGDGEIDGKISVNVTGKPKFLNSKWGIRGNKSTDTDDKSVLTFNEATTSVPYIAYFTKTNVTGNSNITLGNTDKNGFSSGIYDVNINENSTLTINKQAYMLGNLNMNNGKWISNGYAYVTKETNTENSKLTFNSYVALGYGEKSSNHTKTMVNSKDDIYVFNKNSYTNPIYGAVDIQGGNWIVIQPISVKGNYKGTENRLTLPVFEGIDNYPEKAIPFEIIGKADGTTYVKLMADGDFEKEGMPKLGQNYINAKTESKDVFVLSNENAAKADMYFKKLIDADTENKTGYDMWQVATGISVIFDKNGGDTEASPRISSQEKTAEDASYKFALPTVNPTKENFVFNGWNTKPDGTGTAFKANTEVTKSMTVYAQWKADESKIVTITPMDMTVYVGGNGYKGVIGSNGDFVVNDLPQMGCFVTFPDDINDFLGSEIDNPDDLSKHITLKYNNSEGTTRSWSFELYGDESNSTLTHNGRRTYIYKIMPSKIDGTTATVPARMQFTADDGTVMVESQFPVSATDQYRDYKVNFYPGDLDEDLLTVEVTNGDKTIYRSVKFGTGTLKVRGNVDEIYAKVDYGTPKVDSQNEKAFLASAAQENTEYYINETGISVLDPSGVRLMVDSSLDDTFLKDYLNENKNADGKYSYEFKYFDLLDTNNGNAYVEMGSGQKMNVYWPVPEDAASNSQFHVVHFKALHRESDKDMNAILAQNPPTEENCEKVTIDGKEFIKFTVDSFSPFALMYQKKTSSGSSSGGSSHGSHESTMYILHYESNGGTEYKDENYASGTTVKLDKVPARTGYTFDGWYADEELTQKITDIKMTGNKTVYAGWKATQIPSELNGENHFAYVVGYDDGTVRPKADISRAEVATIFFRLLKENVRDENLTADNVFGDVENGKWYNKPVSTMAKIGIIKGRTAKSFVPDAPITRAEFAAICSRFDNSNVEINSSFNDISGHWAEKEIERAASLGWVQGYTDGSFKPDRNITRAEAMAMINRMLHRLPESEEDLLNGMTKWPDNKPSDWYYINVQEATNSHDFERKGEINEKWTAITADPNWEQYK